MVAVCLAAAGIACGLLLAPYQLDDSFITYRYASNLVDGLGLTFNPRGEWVEGFTSPFWLACLSLLAFLFDTKLLPFFGVILGLLSYLLLFYATWRIQAGAQSQAGALSASWLRLPALVLVAFFPTACFYSVTGLEAVLFSCVVVVFAAATAGCIPLSWGIVAGVAALFVRPEGGWLPIMAAIQIIPLWRGLAVRVKSLLLLVAAVAVGGSALLGARWLLFRDILPNTFYAKSPSLSAGLEYALETLSSPWAAGILLLGLGGALWGNAVHKSFFLAALSWFAAAVIEGGDWMPLGRMLLPAVSLCILSASGLMLSVRGRPLSKGHLRGITVAACLVVSGFSVRTILHEAALNDYSMRSTRQEARWLTEWVALSGARSVALVDIGKLGFETESKIVDLAGLTDEYIGRSPGGHLAKEFDLSYLFEAHHPDLIVIRVKNPPLDENNEIRHFEPSDAYAPIEARIMADSRLQTLFRPTLAVLPLYKREPYYGKLVYARNAFTPDPKALRFLPTIPFVGFATYLVPEPEKP